MESSTPSVCIVGNLLGRNPGFITTQGQILADLLKGEKYEVVSVSSKINRAARLLEIAYTIVRNRKTVDVLILEVYSGMSMLIADIASYLSGVFRIPSVFVLHGGNLPEFSTRYPRWTRRVLKRADVLVAPSNYLAQELKIPGREIAVVPNVVEIESCKFRPRHSVEPRLIWMRSFHPVYNPQMALNAFAHIKSIFPQATLTMAGVDKGLEADMKQLARDLGIDEAVRFPGFLNAAEKAREFSQADIYLNTNHIDNMPVSVLEACAWGLPVIATEVGGISRMLKHRENALLVPDNDPFSMSEAVVELVRSPSLAFQISENGRRLADRSSWACVRPLWERMIRDLVSKKTVPFAPYSGNAAERNV